MGITRKLCVAAATLVLTALCGPTPAFAAGESHPLTSSFERSSGAPFSNPNGIAVDEATGDVYVADIGTETVYKFDASGSPLDFAALGSNALSGAATPAGSFSFPSVYGSPAAIAVDNACVQHAPVLTGKACEEFDPSAGDVYVMDAGHGVIDKFSPEGSYLSQIGGFPPSTGSAEGELLGLGVDANGAVHVDLRAAPSTPLVEEFDTEVANRLMARMEWET